MTEKPNQNTTPNLPNEFRVGDCDKEDGSLLVRDFKEAFQILSQEDLASRLTQLENPIPNRNKIWFHSYDGGAWQRPTQVYNFDTGEYTGSIVRDTTLHSHPIASLDPKFWPSYGYETYEVVCSVSEDILLCYKRKEHEGIGSKIMGLLGKDKEESPIMNKSFSLPSLENTTERRYMDATVHGINYPCVGFRDIERRKDLAIEAVNPKTLKITVGKEVPLEFIVDLAKEAK